MSIKTFEEGIKKNSREEIDEYCFEVLTRARIIKFKLTVRRVEFDVKRSKNNKKLVGLYLRCAYDHFLLEKTSRLYQICNVV